MLTSPFKTPEITPPAEHPRLMLRKKHIPQIRENLSHEENRRAYELWRYLCDTKLSQFEGDIEKGYYNGRLLAVIEARAFEALIYDDKAKAKEAVALALRVMKNYDSGNLPLFGGRFSGHVMFTMAQVYDWLYDSFSTDERALMIDLFERSARDLEMGYPPFENGRQCPVFGHDNEAQLLRDMFSVAIAVYDERPDIYDYCAGLFFDKFLPTYNGVNDCRMHIDGTDYGAYRTAFIHWVALIYLSMSDEHIFTDNVENLAEWLLYTLRSDGQALRIGDAFFEDKGGYTLERPFVVPMFLGGALTGNENYRRYYRENFVDEFMLPSRYRGKDYYRDGGFGEGMYSPVIHLIWNRFVEPKETERLPKAKHFGTPVGATFYNDREKETLILMNAEEYGGISHNHLDAGSFQIYHKGILASDSGGYHLFGSMHFKKYATRTVAHNCILIEDDNEKQYTRHRILTGRDGGARIVEGWYTEPKEIFEKYHMSTIISHEESEDGCYMKVDLLPAYGEVCDKIVREMRYEANRGEYGVFTVCDEIETKNASFKKKFLIHSQTEPEIDGNKITITHKGGRLVCSVLAPEEFVIDKIGGEGKEFFVNGENYPDDNMDGKETGWGRVEISPKNNSIYDKFLVEMVIEDK